MIPPKTASDPTVRAQFAAVMTPNYDPMELLPSHGQGARLWDALGREYIDFAGGIAVSALGHAHPELIKALTAQAGKLWHTSNLLVTQPALDLAARLCAATFAERVFFANSGAEANEAALKLARRYAVEHSGAAKHEIIAFDHAFHGRTFFTVCVGGQPKYSENFGPKPGGISHLPFNDADAVTRFFAAHGERVCAVIVEPCQGEGGVIPATAEFIAAIHRGCEQHQTLLIFDEIQTGVGRSGKLYHYENFAITPDILTTAKGLGGGFPISAMLTTARIAESLAVGIHGTTFGGNPMACAVADRVLDLVNRPALLAGVIERGQTLRAGLAEINRRHAVFAEIRGVGLLIGGELIPAYHGRAREIVIAAAEQGLLVLNAGANVLRLAPPLNIDPTELTAGLTRLDQTLNDVFAA